MPAEQRAFIDSNIVFYALGTERHKKKWLGIFFFSLH